MRKGIIVINADNRIINAKTGEEIPFMFNKEEMKKFFEMISISMIAANNNITLKKLVHGTLEPVERVHITTIDFENDMQMNEIVDVEVNEK